MSQHGKIYWNEYNTWDAEKAKEYYTRVLGWTFNEVPTAGTEQDRPYYVAMNGDQPIAGIFTMVKPDFEGAPDHWFTYLAVDDVNKALAESTAAGGKVFREPFEIPGFGILAVVGDSNGAGIGLLQPFDVQAN